jgi:hypothetical protein
MAWHLDQSVYPDVEPPSELRTAEEKADYMERVCAAFDFGVAPEEYTLDLLSTWKDVFDRFPYSGSPAYHALRAYFGWQPVDRLPYFGTPYYVQLDRMEERSDPCENRV